MSRQPETPRRGLWRAEIVRAVLSGHSILGIAFAAAIYLVCLSGTLSVFMRDFQGWEQPDAPWLDAVADRSVARAVASMGARAGADRPIYVTLPSADLPRLMLSTGDEDGGETWYADARGKLAVQAHAPWTDFIVDLHTRLHLPETWGRFLVGLTGVALLSSLISGVLAHPRVFRDAFHLRLGGSRRLEQADLHDRLGIWPLPFHVIVSLTGALLGLSTVIVGVLALLLFRGDATKVYALLAPPRPVADARPAAPPDIAAILAIARARVPDAVPQQLTVTHWGRRDLRIELSAARPRLIAQQDSFSFDAAGRIVAEKHPADHNAGERILGSLGPLHFGWFGGLPVRLAYGALGLALCVVTSSGVNVWLARRLDKGRAAPIWERVWAAVCWGQPAAFSLAALVAIVGALQVDARRLTLLWLFATIASLLGVVLVRVEASRVANLTRRSTGGLLIATGASYLVTRVPQGKPAVLMLTLVILTIGLGMLALARRPLRRQ